MVFTCGECGEEYGIRDSNRWDKVWESMLMLHLTISGHCQQEAWTHKSPTQKELQRKFEESLTRADADLLRGYGVKV